MMAHFWVKGIKVPQSESKLAIVLKQILHLNCTTSGTKENKILFENNKPYRRWDTMNHTIFEQNCSKMVKTLTFSKKDLKFNICHLRN